MTDHHEYVSSACTHAMHDECRERCRFCGAACLCACHGRQVERAGAAVAPRCARCAGSGVLAGGFDYCECQMGRDLAVAARRLRSIDA